ncbi:dna repair protein-like protein rad18 [Bimuria novae-zelandiae CBS 107.79]|uniref:Dna repair protein-like protein rad18 n=1 Tax=Bimuria novae-zelandiae CBS 107.79 TaxID=1447943 RepID=A0A6A5V1A0_9PLEO|nr:dna repair protein-like protein rad18 [Bimuria novae-zelandiae CBS 107.79]
MAQVLPAKRPRGLSHRHQLSVDSLAPPRKRPRSSYEPPAEPSETSDAEQDLASMSSEEASAAADDADALEIRLAQIVQEHAQKQHENSPREHGIIEEIGCTNFMCHERLTVKLGPLINFIIGHNGSGKSAVLTALTLCLGGKANATNRGQNLRSFIKSGKTWSTLSVKIKNQGPGAYKPEQYGDSIIVERHITEHTSGFKIKDRNGRVVSTRKFELEDIIDYFGLQMENPLNVLTQDMARQFLNDSNAKDKYKFFLKGTQLETLDRDYAQIQQELEEQNTKAQTLEKDVEDLRKKFEDLYKKSQNARRLEKFRAEEQAIRNQATWAYVAADEAEAAAMDDKIEELSQEILRLETEAGSASEELARYEKALEDAQTAVADCEAQLEPARDAKGAAEATYDAAKKKYLEHRAEERTLQRAIQNDQKRKESTQSQIDSLKEAQAGGRHEQKVREFEAMRKEYAERQAAWEGHDKPLDSLTQDYQKAQDEHRRARTSLADKKKEEKAAIDEIDRLKRGQHKWTDAFPKPDCLEKLLRAIKEERSFKTPPVGPVGKFVELKHPRWSSILEKSLGRSLNAFIVTNKQDQMTLAELMQRWKYDASITIVSNTTHIDTSSKEPDRTLLTIDRALKIENDAVRNYLLANGHIDQAVLIQDRQKASEFAQNHSTTVKYILCWSDQDHRRGHSFTPIPTGAVSFNPVAEYQGMSRMRADQAHQIKDKEERLGGIQDELNQLARKAKAAEDSMNRCKAKINTHNLEKKRLQQRMDRAQGDMTRLEGEVAATVPNTAELEQLETSLKEYDDKLNLDNEQLNDLSTALEEAKKEQYNCERISQAARQAVVDLERKLDRCQTKVQRLTQQRDQALRNENHATEQVEAAKAARIDWEKSRDELQLELDSHIREARAICERVEVPRGATFDSLMRQIDAKVKMRADLEKQLGGSQQQLAEMANTAKKNWKDANKFVKDVNALRNGLAHALSNRINRWAHFRDEISVRARVTFIYLLSERRFLGKLFFDHGKRALDMGIQPDKTVEDGTTRQTKTLSGGEKSFSTTCLLIALWDAMGSPIRCLDEFDVFMDNVNRDKSMDMIIAAARRSTGRQYILITPQAMNNKSVSKMQDVKVIKMSDPDRGQTALNFAG